MTKSRDNKQAIRAYMRAHGVNYTTAKRALREQADARASLRWAIQQDTDTVHSVTAAQVAESSRIEQDADDNTVLGPLSYADDTTGAIAPLVKNTHFANPVDDVQPCPDCGHGTSDGRLACDPACTQGRLIDLTTGPGLTPDEWHLDRDEDGYALTVRRTPVFLAPHLQRAALDRFPHVHDLNGTCLHNRNRDLCVTELGQTPARPTVAAITAAYSSNLAFHPDAANVLPVFLDPTKATMADQTRAQHLHDLNGRCIKNRDGHFCPSPPSTQINMLRDLNTRPQSGGAQTGDAAREIHTINKPQPKFRTAAHSSDHPPVTATIRLTDSRGRIIEDRTPPAADDTPQDAPLPDGTTIRQWYATTIDPNTGERVPTLMTQTRYPANTRGERREVVTQTPFTGSMATDEAWAALAGTPTRRDELVAALKADAHASKTNTKADAKADTPAVANDALNAHRRAHAPGPAPADIQAALEQLADNELALRELTSDPETPVTYAMLRHAILATTTHGETWGGGKWHPTAADVCRSYLLGIEVTTSHDTPEVDGQHYVHPEDLAGIIAELADDEMALDEAVEGTAVTADDIAEELLILANRLSEPHDPKADVSPPTSDDHHYLVVTAGQRRSDRRYKIDCTTPTSQASLCEGWEQCPDCTHLTLNDDAYDELLDTGIAHGIEHVNMSFGPAIRTGQCALQAFPEAWEESDAILNLPPGRYAINSKWEDEYCTIWLRTH